jgi:hypothetical protein
MARAGLALSEGIPRIIILFGILFVALNILDAQLTAVAVAIGSREVNPIAATGFGSSMLLKGLISSAMVMALVLLKRGTLLKPLSLAMLVICAWNGFAVWSWT